MFKEELLKPEAVINRLREKLSEAQYESTVNQLIVENFRNTLSYLANKYPEVRKELENNGKSESGRKQESGTKQSD